MKSIAKALVLPLLAVLLVGCKSDDTTPVGRESSALDTSPSGVAPSASMQLPPTQVVDQVAQRSAPTSLSADHVIWVLEQLEPIHDKTGNPVQVEVGFISPKVIYANACWLFDFDSSPVRPCADNTQRRVMIYVVMAELRLKSAAEAIGAAYDEIVALYRTIESKRP